MNRFIRDYVRRPAAVLVVLLLAACGQQDEAATGATEADKVPVTTSSAEALKLYMEGRALFDDLHFTEAHEVFIEAVDNDPNFAMGHFMVAQTSQTASDFFAAIAKAEEHLESASAGEQLFIRALAAAAEQQDT